jgi:alkylation response protein AidB-like acyl-CoA dehydrogenase
VLPPGRHRIEPPVQPRRIERFELRRWGDYNAEMRIRGLQPTYVERARALAPLIREHADRAEEACRLPEVVAKALAAQGLYRVGAPVPLLGADADPATQIEVIEAVARADGSAGWNLMIGIEVFGQIAPFLGATQALLEDSMLIMCGATSAMGRADREDGGYRVNGQWQFVSGCHNASLFAGTVMRYEQGLQIDGPPAFAVARDDEYEILDTWDVSGMRGSGSHDLRLVDLWLPEERLVVPAEVEITERTPLQRIPLGVKLSYNKVGVCLGIARAGVDAFVELATGKRPRFGSEKLRERPLAQRAIAEAEVRLRSARALVFEMVEELWETVVASGRLEDRWRALFQIACSDAARACVEAVDTIAEAAGTTPNFVGQPLERIVRDVRVVRQHITVAPQHIEDGGRMLLGLPPLGMMLDHTFLERRPDQRAHPVQQTPEERAR